MRHQLELEHDYDFDLIAICSRTGDYKMCWALNKVFGYELKKEEEDINLLLGKETRSKHSLYMYEDKNTYTLYRFFANKGTRGHLVPEQKQADYFLMIHDRFDEQLTDLVSKLREISFVLTAYTVNPESLKSKENLIF